MKKSKLFSRIGLSVIALPWLLLLGYYLFITFVDPGKERSGMLFALTYGVIFGIAGVLIGAPFLVRSLLYTKWEKEASAGQAATSSSILDTRMSPLVFFTIIAVLLMLIVLFVMPSDFLATLRPLFTLFFKVW